MEKDERQFMTDFSTGMNIALIAIFSLNRTVQIWSRVIGTTGTWYFGLLFFLGLFFQAWYYEANVHRSMQTDWIPFGAVVGLSLIWFAIHGVKRASYRMQGIRLHSWEPGVGILYFMLPTWHGPSIALASDLCVAAALSLLLRLCHSPILSGWYAAMCVWLLMAHLWFQARDSRRRQAWDNSRIEAERWSEQIRRSDYE